MSKKVLIVENSLAVRNIAESLLRQNGYQVVSAEDSGGAREILGSSRVDLILASSDISEPDGRKFYEVLGSDSATATLPLLILHDPTLCDLAYPPEAVVNKPFTPREFLDKVSAFTGGGVGPVVTKEVVQPEGGVEDELIDQALGLDRLEVDGTEVMGNDTGVFRAMNKKVRKESMIGFEFKADSEDTTDTGRKTKSIDQVKVPADQKTSGQPPKEEVEFLGQDSKQFKVPPKEGLSESSKIEIVTDQYGMIDPHQFEPDESHETHRNHDYNWFINEMQKESSGTDTSDTGSLKLEPTSQGLDPVTPVSSASISGTKAKQTPLRAEASAAPTHTQAVDKFISEFKKEMEKISEDGSPGLADIPVKKVASDKTKATPKGTDFNWEEAIERVSTEARVISRELVAAIAQKVTVGILARIDQEHLYRLIRECFVQVLEKRLKNR